ncbi:NAD(P)/FAD-dependent oxidoreductase [bacterium]|jgi:sulfide:quinone oxidoreductase|nr:NAD(P)/FAD-dependent oxidoreductase [bacterium]
MKDRLKNELKIIDNYFKDNKLSRREAIKLMGLAGTGVLASSSTLEAKELNNSSEASGHIVIVGGGLAGMATAARIRDLSQNTKITIIEPNPDSVSYQPGQTLIAGGLWTKEDIIYKTKDFLTNDVTLIEEKALEFDPKNNKLTTDSGNTFEYDALIIAAGIKLNYSAIKGLEEAGEAYSIGDNSKLVKELNSVGASSIYTVAGASETWENINKFIVTCKNTDSIHNAIFTHPNTPIKCGGAPKKIMYLMNSILKENNVRDKVNMHFYPNGGAMFGIKDYHEAIVKQFEREKFNYSYKHNLVEVSKGNAIFNKHSIKKGAWDEDLEEYEAVKVNEKIEVPFDFLHITPPMKAPDEIGNSPLGSKKGWVPVNKETLQHVKFDNVFALGDIATVPMGKTGGSARKQYKVVTNNVLSILKDGSIPSDSEKYDGYTVCPLITSIGSVMLAEFNWASKKTGSGKNAASISLLDPTQERYIWWLLKLYLLKPMTVYGMLSGKA